MTQSFVDKCVDVLHSIALSLHHCCGRGSTSNHWCVALVSRIALSLWPCHVFSAWRLHMFHFCANEFCLCDPICGALWCTCMCAMLAPVALPCVPRMVLALVSNFLSKPTSHLRPAVRHGAIRAVQRPPFPHTVLAPIPGLLSKHTSPLRPAMRHGANDALRCQYRLLIFCFELFVQP